MMSGGQEQKIEETVKEREPGVYVFLPDESDPSFEYDPEVDASSVTDQISKEREVMGYLTKRNSKRRVLNALSAGEYDFHITERVSQPQPQGK